LDLPNIWGERKGGCFISRDVLQKKFLFLAGDDMTLEKLTFRYVESFRTTESVSLYDLVAMDNIIHWSRACSLLLLSFLESLQIPLVLSSRAVISRQHSTRQLFPTK
jgi:hypothetical protein